MRRWTTLSETDYMTTTFMIMITRAEFSVSMRWGGGLDWMASHPPFKEAKSKKLESIMNITAER